MRKQDDTTEAAAEWLPIESLTPWADNPRSNAHAVPEVAKSIKRFGFASPIIARPIDGGGLEIVAGHTRHKAAQSLGLDRVPVRVMDLDPADAKLLALADNRLGELADWTGGLEDILRELDADGVDLDGLGWSTEELDALTAPPPIEPDGSEDDVPELQEEVHSKPGEVYELGPHRLVCGDSTDRPSVELLLDGDSPAVLLHADPPYGMGKESDGVLNDNLYRERLDEFQMSWLNIWLDYTADNGSLYIWGNAKELWRLWFSRLSEVDGLLVRNEIVWAKGSGIGMRSEGMHSYSVETERCLFIMRGEQFIGNQNKDDFWEGYRPLLDWLRSERDKAGWVNKDVNRITGSQMAGHWFSESQFQPIGEERYRQLQVAADGSAFSVPYGELFGVLFPNARGGGNAHRRQLAEHLREIRSYFDNTHDTMTDVWQFPRVVGDERYGHATPKPVAMICRAIKSSAAEGGLVLEPFGGTGTTLIACAMTGRRARLIELDPRYCDIIRRRWTRWAKDHGQEPGPGALE